jgi:predicted ArsR family transcriptional regulator
MTALDVLRLDGPCTAAHVARRLGVAIAEAEEELLALWVALLVDNTRSLGGYGARPPERLYELNERGVREFKRQHRGTCPREVA